MTMLLIMVACCLEVSVLCCQVVTVVVKVVWIVFRLLPGIKTKHPSFPVVLVEPT